MDMRWDEYTEYFGYTPEDYIGSESYKAKYGDDEVKYIIILLINGLNT